MLFVVLPPAAFLVIETVAGLLNAVDSRNISGDWGGARRKQADEYFSFYP